ncbi:MAG: hypothetical protein Kow0059_15800 [Candidatus Sumerlaeia bacterium]
MTELELEVFRAGDYGDKGCWTEADLARIAADYDPALHEAPVTLDHAQSGPAWGWVRALRAAGPMLLATVHQVSDQLAAWLHEGRFKKRSIELYTVFPATGRPYLRALSFLGAAVPEVKGLADPLFADDGASAIRLPFREHDQAPDGSKAPESSMERAAGVSADPRTTPASDGGACVSAPRSDAGRSRPAPHFEPRRPRVAEPDPALVFRENERLRNRIAHLERQAARADIEAICLKLEREGRLPPAWREAGIAAFMESLREMESRPAAAQPHAGLPAARASDSIGEARSGGASTDDARTTEADAAITGPAAARFRPFTWFVAFLESLPAVVPLSESAPSPGWDAPAVNVADFASVPPDLGAPHSVRVDPASLERHRRVLALRRAEPALTYAEALRRVG